MNKMILCGLPQNTVKCLLTNSFQLHHDVIIKQKHTVNLHYTIWQLTYILTLLLLLCMYVLTMSHSHMLLLDFSTDNSLH